MKKLGTIVGWTSALLVAALNLFAGIMKFMPVEAGSETELMQKRLGLYPEMEYALGVLELIIVVLFLIPRTSTVGFVLMVGYMAGVLATMLTHGFTHAESFMIYVSLLLLSISAYFRNPELLDRIKGRK